MCYIDSVVVIVIMCLDATKPTEPTQLASLPIRELSSIQYPILSNPVTLVLVTNLEFCIDSRVFSRFHNIIKLLLLLLLLFVAIIAAAVGGGALALFILIIILVVIMLCICCGKKSKGESIEVIVVFVSTVIIYIT